MNPLTQGNYFNKGAQFIDIFIAEIPIQKGLVAAQLIDNSDFFEKIPELHGKAIKILLDNNLISNTATPIHELFHVFQYNYCHFNNMWFMEGLARWSQNITHERGNLEEKLPATKDELEYLISRAHDAEYFWRELISKCGNTINFVRILLEQSALQAEELEKKLNLVHWTKENKKSSLNNEYIFKAIIKTIEILQIQPDSELEAFINIIQGHKNIIKIGTINLSSLSENELKKLEGVEEIDGDLIIDSTNITSVNNFNRLKKVNTIKITNNINLLEILGFNTLESVKNIEISNNENLEEINCCVKFFSNIKKIDGFIKIESNKKLTSIACMHGIKEIGSSFYLHHNSLKSLAGLERLESVGASFSLASNNLASLKELNNLTTIGGSLSLVNNDLTSLNGLENLSKLKTSKWNGKNRTIAIFNNDRLEDISALSNILTDDNYMIIQMDSLEQYKQKPLNTSNFHKNILELHDHKNSKVIPTYLFTNKSTHNYENFRKATHNNNFEYLLDFELDCETLIISFSGFNGYLGGIFHNRYPYITDGINTNKIFINDNSNMWYQNGIPKITSNITQTIDFIKSFIKFKNYKKIVCVGASMGGYMALLVGKLINATDILAISPQTFLDTKTRKKFGDTRWKKEIEKLNIHDSKYLNIKELFANATDINIQIHYASKLTLDKIHVEYLNLNSKFLVSHDLDDHYLAVYLHKNGQLENIIKNIFDNNYLNKDKITNLNLEIPEKNLLIIKKFFENNECNIIEFKLLTDRVGFVYKIQTDKGKRYIIKHKKNNGNIIYREILAYMHFKDIVTLPKIFYNTDDFIIKEYIDGIALDKLTLNDKKEAYFEMGKVVKKYHSIKSNFKYCGKIKKSKINDTLSFKTWYNVSVIGMLHIIKEKGLLSQIEYDSLLKFLENNQHYLEEDNDLYLINYDLLDDNIFWKNNSIIMIDLDDLALFPKEMDLAKVYLEQKQTGLFEYFIKGYGYIDLQKVKFCAVLDMLEIISANHKKNKRLVSLREKRKKTFINIILSEIIFSVIITAYNIQEYIFQAIDSVLGQTYPAFEIIVIDDGSTDATFELATKKLEGIKNSKVIKQENRGPGGARNRGISAATGDYIVFLDGDDWLIETALSVFKSQAESHPDAIFCNRIWFHEKGSRYESDIVFTKSTQGKVASGRELLRRYAVPAKAFKREFLIINQIIFPEKMAWEDYPFSHNILAYAQTINVATEVVYVARKRDGNNESMTQKQRLGEFFLQSRFRQIDMDREIISNSHLSTIFKGYDFDNLEFETRLMMDVKYLARESDIDILTHAIKRFKSYIQENKKIILNCVSVPAQKIYKAILKEDLSSAIKLIIAYYEK